MANKKKNNPASRDRVGHPADDSNAADGNDDLAETRELPSAVGAQMPMGSERAGSTAVVDELADTGEFPVLDPALFRDDHAIPGHINGVALAPDGQVSYLLNHLASEIERLQSRWNDVDGELRLREERIEELSSELAGKDVIVERQARDLTAAAATQSESKRLLAALESRLSGLLRGQERRDVRLAERDRQLEAAKKSHEQLQQQLTAARAEVARLKEHSVAEKRTTSEAVERTRELAASNNELRSSIEVLESYIDRRKQSWSELNANLARYQDSLIAAEKVAAEQERRSIERERTNDALSRQSLELERRCAELVGRLTEREEASDDLQAKLADQIDAASQLRLELESRVKIAAETVAQLDRQIELTAAREREVAERDAKIAELEKTRAAERQFVVETAATNEQRATRVSELESALREMRDELDRVARERQEEVGALSVSQSRVAELERLIGAATKEAERLGGELLERDEQVARLESSLVAKQRALDLLDQNVQLINNLGASLQHFDRKFSAAGPEVLSADLVRTNPPVTRNLLVALGDEGRSYTLDKDDTTIGRSALSDIVIRDPCISRVHARIFRRDTDTVIEDPGSKNGILVNSRPIAHTATLHDGDTISLGGVLEFRYVASAAPAPAQPKQ